jgi:predicted branched-subunit amino acid permease
VIDEPAADRRAIRRDALGIAVAAGVYAVSFGVIATVSGLTALQTCVLSLTMFTGASQFAFVGVIGSGGLPYSGVATALLLGARNGLYGMRLAPILRPRGLRRPVTAQFVIDETTAMTIAQDRDDDARQAFWSTGIALFVLWNVGTAIGALAGPVIGDPATYGLDAAIPAAFVALLWPQLPDLASRLTAVLAVGLTLVLVPLVPIGIPVLAAGLVAVGVAMFERPGRSARGDLPVRGLR